MAVDRRHSAERRWAMVTYALWFRCTPFRDLRRCLSNGTIHPSGPMSLVRAWVADSPPLLDLIQEVGAWEHPLLQQHFPETIIIAILSSGENGNRCCRTSTICLRQSVTRMSGGRTYLPAHVPLEMRKRSPLTGNSLGWVRLVKMLGTCSESACSTLMLT